jgi:hypothetical protein
VSTPEDLAAVPPPTSPGDVPADRRDMWGAERDPADNLGLAVSVPSVADSPHWTEIKT